MSPLTCNTIPLHAKAVTNVGDSTLIPSHCSKLSGYDRCILPFVDVEAKEGIEHVRDKEKGMKEKRGSYGVSTVPI